MVVDELVGGKGRRKKTGWRRRGGGVERNG